MCLQSVSDPPGIAKNSLTVIPTNTLEFVASRLVRLDLGNNYFNFLGSTGANQGNLTFPSMPQLEELILDNSDIRAIELDTFSNLPNLKILSLKENPLSVFSPALMLQGLEILKLGIQEDFEMDSVGEFFDLPPQMFNKNPMPKLRVLEIHNANFGNLSDYHFSGLHKLEVLSLQNCKFFHFTDMLFGNLTNLKNLSLAYVDSKNSIELKHLQGPFNLLSLDLTFASFNLSAADAALTPGNKTVRTSVEEIESNPIYLLLHSIEVLNLTGTLIELDNPLESLFLEYVENLTIFQVGENKIEPWKRTMFKKNSNMKTFKMAKNGVEITLTPEMLEDFFFNTELEVLDLSENIFICSFEVFKFFQLSLNHSNIDIVGYDKGTGYFCIDTEDKGNQLSFLEYATKSHNIEEGTDISSHSTRDFVIGISAGLACVLLLTGLLYHKRWYLKYHYYWLIRKPVNREEPFQFDVFTSYSQHNEAWLHNKLLPVLEGEGGGNHNKISVCYHERDFDPGKSIVENIVDSIDRSRKCLIILSDKYIGSSWCMFEAHLASHRLIQVSKSV